MLPLRKLGRSIPSFIYMGCSRRDLGTPPRIQVSRCDPNVRNVHKGNNGIKLFLARMRFWRGTAASTTFWQFVPASPRELSGPPRRAPGQGAQFRHSVSLQLAERIAVKAERNATREQRRWPRFRLGSRVWVGQQQQGASKRGGTRQGT